MMMRVALFSLLALAICSRLQCVQAQAPRKTGFDFGRLLGGRRSEGLKGFLLHLPEVQSLIDTTKNRCIAEMNMPADQRMLINEPNPTEQEKCLVECVLKGIKLMDSKSNRLSLERVAQLTGMVTENNQVVMTLSCSLAGVCNRSVTSKEPCEAAHQLNQCIGRQLARNQVNLFW